jgi:hypothetical protein
MTGTWPFSGDAVLQYLLTSTKLVLLFLSGLVLARSLHCYLPWHHLLTRPTECFPTYFLLACFKIILAALAQVLVESSNIKSPRKRGHSPHQLISQRTFSNHFLTLTMKFTSTIISLAALFSVASAEIVRYNTIYDNPTTSMNIVACSNGDNGLVTRFPTFGDLPTFPSAGGVFAVSGWNSPECGSCWRLRYKGNSIYVTAIDMISDGFDISLEAMNLLTNNQAQALDSIDAHARQVHRNFCGTA